MGLLVPGVQLVMPSIKSGLKKLEKIYFVTWVKTETKYGAIIHVLRQSAIFPYCCRGTPNCTV
jgi:hypothetical protein